MEHVAQEQIAGDDRYRLLLEAITDYAIYMLDPEGHVSSWNPGALRFKGYEAEEILGEHFSRFYTEEDKARGMPERALRAAASEDRFENEGWRVRKDGSHFWAHVVIDPIRSSSGDVLGFAKITRDLTEKRATEEALRKSQEQFRLLVQSVTEYAIYMLDATGQVTSWNTGARRIKGYEPEEIIGQHFSRFYTEEDRQDGSPVRALETAEREGRFEHEGWRVRQDGTRFWASVAMDAIRDDDGYLIGFAEVTRDTTEKRRAQEELLHLAHHDPLTGLVNRSILHEQLDRALAASSPGRQTALLFTDLDGFKSVNDTLGHKVGDRVLVQVAERLRASVRSADIVARFGGDEFAVIARVKDQQEATALADRILAELRLPFALEGRTVTLGGSMGIVMVSAPGARPDDVLQDADIALYRAKAEGRGVYRLFEPEMGEAIKRRQELKRDLKASVERGELFVEYQPLVDFRTPRIMGFEALVRWKHPTKGLIPPGTFIPIAEEAGFILEIGEWVLAQACKEAASWPNGLLVAVNLSPVQFQSGNMVATVERCLSAAGLPASQLQLEITESVLLINSAANLEALHDLRRLGVSIAMDDFGTGYSSLSYLRSFPFDKIKIDRAFVSDLAGDSAASGEPRAIIQAIIELSRGFGVRTTAEGVETEYQARALRDMGCDEGQGYFYRKPVSAKEIPDIIAEEPNDDRYSMLIRSG